MKLHGLSNHPAHKAWRNMLQRCQNAKYPEFRHYGGRGIKICQPWESFIDFWNDMKGTYKPGLTLDRKDVNGHYEPGNCRWATRLTQSRNRRKWGGTSSQFRGVSFHIGKQKWQSRIRVGDLIHLGSFDTETTAAHAYDRAALKHFGPSAILNFPNL